MKNFRLLNINVQNVSRNSKMKKLLTILICLFVSFDVKSKDSLSDREFLKQINESESNDLDGKKLLCHPFYEKLQRNFDVGEGYTVLNGVTYINFPIIFEFLPNYSVSIKIGHGVEMSDIIIERGRYLTTLEEIYIKVLKNKLYYNYEIDRQDLEVRIDSQKHSPAYIQFIKESDVVDRRGFWKCDLFVGNSNNYFKKHYDEYLNRAMKEYEREQKEKEEYNKKLKSKQKI